MKFQSTWDFLKGFAILERRGAELSIVEYYVSSVGQVCNWGCEAYRDKAEKSSALLRAVVGILVSVGLVSM